MLDVAVFEGLLAACQSHRHRGPASCASCARRLPMRYALYRGDFLTQVGLPDGADIEEWVTLMRERLHQQVVDALGL